jgi:cytochrome c oxidase assembly protein subunit 15
MFLFPISNWIGGIFFEHIHRLIASTVGLLTVILAVWLWRTESRRWLRNLGWFALLGVMVQGLLGGLRVTLLKDEIGIFHACVAHAFFGVLVLIALSSSRCWHSAETVPSRWLRKLRWLAIIGTGLVYLQLILGATMRHQHRDLSILDFPLAYGQLLPDTSPSAVERINDWRDRRALSDVTATQIWLQMTHRFGAVLTATAVIATALIAIRHRREISTALGRVCLLWSAALLMQLILGAWTIWSNKAADVATAHVAIGATMFALGLTTVALSSRVRLVEGIRSTAQPQLAMV